MRITVIMLDTHRTRMAIQFENEHIPFGRRTVHIDLTPGQIEKLQPRQTGTFSGQPVVEEIGPVFLEEQP